MKAGAPKDCIQWIEHPSIEATSALMHHKDIATILATGGPSMVEAAYTSGKPALGVGPGNVPVYIHEDADIERAVKNGKNDPEAREKMHNDATIAGMAFGNAFLGIVHSLAHKVGAEFHTVHGETCGIILPHAIRYNGTQPSKLSVWPKYETYQCDKKYLKICQTVGLPCSSKEEAKDVLADAVIALGKDIGIDMNLASIIPDEAAFMSKIEELAYLAYEDQCTPANPRLPLVSDMMDILVKAYKGN